MHKVSWRGKIGSGKFEDHKYLLTPVAVNCIESPKQIVPGSGVIFSVERGYVDTTTVSLSVNIFELLVTVTI